MGNILDEAIPAEELDASTYKIKCLLTSPSSGAGKTTGACSIPGKKLLVDFDNRAEAVAGWKDVKILPCWEKDTRSPEAYTRALEIKKWLWVLANKGEFPYDLVIFDGATSFGYSAMLWALLLNPKHGLGGTPAEHHHSPQMKAFRDYVVSTIGLPCHVIWTGHENLVQHSVGTEFIYLPKVVSGKLTLATEIPKWFNETYYCYRVNEVKDGILKHRFYWQTQGSGQREYLKSTMNQLQRYWTDPIEIDWTSEDPVGFADLLERRFPGWNKLHSSAQTA